jgi:hypothetical protein
MTTPATMRAMFEHLGFTPGAASSLEGNDHSEETSVKVHCVSNATIIIPRPKRCHGNIPRSNMSQKVTGSLKEYSCTNAPAFMHLINLTASLLHKICKKSLTTAKLKSLFFSLLQKQDLHILKINSQLLDLI